MAERDPWEVGDGENAGLDPWENPAVSDATAVNPNPNQTMSFMQGIARQLDRVPAFIRGGAQGYQEVSPAMGQQMPRAMGLAFRGFADPSSVQNPEQMAAAFGADTTKNIPIISRPDPRMTGLPSYQGPRGPVVTDHTSEAASYGSLLDMVMPTGLEGGAMIGGRILKAFGRGGQKAGIAMGAKSTGASRKAVEEASTKSGRIGQEFAHASRGTHGERFADDLDNLEMNLPEKAEIDLALKSTPKVSLQPVIEALEGAKNKIPVEGIVSEAGEKAIAKIDDMISRLKVTKAGTRAEQGQAFRNNFSGESYRRIRQILDEGIDWREPWANLYSSALKDARGAAKNELIKSAPPSYAPAMKKWHEKIELGEEMKAMIGKEDGARQDIRAGAFLNQAAKSAPGSPQRKLLKKFEEYTGTKHTDEAEKAMRAREFGPEGKPEFTPGLDLTKMGEWIPGATYTRGVIPFFRGVEGLGAGLQKVPLYPALPITKTLLGRKE